MDQPTEMERLRRDLDQARARERELGDTRRAVLNLLEDLDDDRQRLARAEQEWRAAFDGIRDAIFMHDSEGNITGANQAYRLLAGEDQVLGRPYWEVFPRRDSPLPGCPERGTEEQEIEAGGNVFRSRAFGVRDSEGRYLFSLHILEDITERRRSELALRQRTEELARTNQALEKAINDLTTAERVLIQAEKLAAIGTLASGVAHELNNPLMGVMNYVSYARGKLDDPKAQKALDGANRELQRMAGFVRNLLVLGRPTGEVLVAVDVGEALTRATDLLAADMRKANVQLERVLPDDLPKAWGSLSSLQQVFINLLLNAMSAMEGQTEKRIRVEAWVADDRLKVRVQDNGPGVPAEARDRIFEPFYSTKAEGQGTGLGLPMSHRIMSGFGGKLELEERPGPGASFLLTLRIASLE